MNKKDIAKTLGASRIIKMALKDKGPLGLLELKDRFENIRDRRTEKSGAKIKTGEER